MFPRDECGAVGSGPTRERRAAREGAVGYGPPSGTRSTHRSAATTPTASTAHVGHGATMEYPRRRLRGGEQRGRLTAGCGAEVARYGALRGRPGPLDGHGTPARSAARRR